MADSQFNMKKTLLLSFSALVLTACSSNETELFVVNGSAMEPAFENGDYVLVGKTDRDFEPGEVVVYTNANGNIILGRITGISEEVYEINPDNEELGVNEEEYLPTSEEEIIGTATLCLESRLKCWLKTL